MRGAGGQAASEVDHSIRQPVALKAKVTALYLYQTGRAPVRIGARSLTTRPPRRLDRQEASSS